MAVTTRTFTGTWSTPDNQPQSGYIEFKPHAAQREVNDSKMIAPTTIRVQLDANGKLNDVTGITLVRVAGGYDVTEMIVGALPYTYFVPDAAGPTDLSTLS